MRCASIGLPAVLSQKDSIEHETKSYCAGFTLLEALIALVILALGLQALYQSYSGGLRVSRVAFQHEQARVLAESLLDEHTVSRNSGTRLRSGKFQDYAWSVVVEPAPNFKRLSDSQWALYRVSVEVKWPRDRNLRLNTLKLMTARK